MIGGMFFHEGVSVDATALVAGLREDGKPSKVDPRSVSGFGADGVVGVAVHPPDHDWWAVTDSADGCPGLGAGPWSRVAMIANHLMTEAIWYRAYRDDLALALKFERGSDWMRAVVGTRGEIEAWLDGHAVPRGAPAPRDAGPDAVVVAIQYEESKYRQGPDADVTERLLAVRGALDAGDGTALLERCAAIEEVRVPLALAVIRAAEGDAAQRCLRDAAVAIVAAPLRPRTAVKQMTVDEEVLRRAAEVAAGTDAAAFAAFVARLDEIESDAERRSDWANPGGLYLLGGVVDNRGLAGEAFACYARVLRRGDEPAWYHVSRALLSLLAAHPGPIALDGELADVVARCERRARDLGQSAQDPIYYNLACVYARAGQRDAALAALGRCQAVRAQNPHPERDTDFESLWTDPAFQRILDGAAQTVGEDEDDDDFVPPARPVHVPPPERAVPRQRITLTAGETESRLVSRAGGLPSVAVPAADWPDSPHRPMQFVFQLVGRAAGGELDLGPVGLIQVFADLDGDYYDPRYHVVRLHERGMPLAVPAPPGTAVAPVRVMSFEDGADDSILAGDDMDHDDWEAAHSTAWCDKLRGVPVAANLDPNVRDSRGGKMDCLVQLISLDDWFVWHLFVSQDFSEAMLEIVRG